MNALRASLIVLSLAGSAFLVYVFVDEGRHLLSLAYASGLLLNAGYLYFSKLETKDAAPRFRLWRLLSLWADAKEAELRKRAKPD